MTTAPNAHADSRSATDGPSGTVVTFLHALRDYDVDGALDLVSEDLEFANASLPTVHGRSRFERLVRSLLRPDRLGVDVHFNHVATDGEVVLTDRIDEVSFRRFKSRFWVYGRCVVRDGKIVKWRDSFDWLDVTIGTLRGMAGLVSPSLNRRMPRD
jgi:limonene-1,2-epoxide hydrolase